MNNYSTDVSTPLESLPEQQSTKTFETLFVNEFTDGLIGPESEFLGPLRDGGTIIATTAPGCWGPMLTPAIKGTQEVTKPVYIEGAEVGDAVIIEVQSIQMTSLATASGVEERIVDRYISDPFLKVKCPGCGKLHPQTYVEGIGPQSIRCATCQTPTAPVKMANGYTVAFDDQQEVALTVGKEGTRKVASEPESYLRLPENSIQNPVVRLASSDVVGVATRMRPFIAELGTVPSKQIPASNNAGDTGRALFKAPLDMRLTEQELREHCTDGHLHTPHLREGAVLICPVRVKGAGVYIGDIHALQGAGGVAGHAPSVSGIVQLKISVLKKADVSGPVLFPLLEDLPPLAKPLTREENRQAREISEDYQLKQIEESFPVSVVGTGASLNEATANAIARMSILTNMSIEEVKNRLTICGGIEVGRMPGLIVATAQFPKTVLKQAKVFKIARKQYNRY